MSKRALLSAVPLLSLLSLLSFINGCGNESPTPTATAVPERSAALTTAAPPASASAAIPAVSASVPPVVSAAPAVSASATATASAAAPIADAGAPQDAGAKPAKTAAPKASAAPSATVAEVQADAGAPPAGDAGAAPAVAGGPAQDLAKQVDAIFLGKKTYSAKFKQEYTLKVSGQVKNSSGVAFIERPNKISFRYDPPNKNRVVSDGTTLKVYVAEDNQMFESPVQKTEYPGAFAFLMGKGIASSFNFSVNDKVTYPAGTVLLGKPLQPNPAYETAMFFINKAMLDKSDPGVVERVLIVDAQGNKNRFFFEGATQPATIDPSEFTFTPPPGTNITH
ncbi:MAG: outer membrane lipoprotein carrier protein LolA [Byssovorax sp.]